MALYLIEGLDCSGKKAVGRELLGELARRDLVARMVSGPLIGGQLARLDGRLANITAHVDPRSMLGRGRRSLYVVEPVMDGLLYRTRRHRIDLKVSSHYRAWARAIVDRDWPMTSGFQLTLPLAVRYRAASYLTASFAVRLARHRSDVARGVTKKQEAIRFHGPDEKYFASWDAALSAIMRKYVRDFLVLDTTSVPIEVLASRIADHVVQTLTNVVAIE